MKLHEMWGFHGGNNLDWWSGLWHRPLKKWTAQTVMNASDSEGTYEILSTRCDLTFLNSFFVEYLLLGYDAV
jgi:hypothetical protein